MDGSLVVKGTVSTGAAAEYLTNSAGQVLGGRIAEGSVGTNQLADGAVNTEKLDPSGEYTVAGLKSEGDVDVYDPTLLGPELVINGGFEGTYVEGLAPDWSLDGSAYVTPSEETSDVYAGASSQKAACVSCSFTGVKQGSLSLVAGEWYRIAFAAKVLSGKLSQVQLSGAGFPTQVLMQQITSAEWTVHEALYRAEATATVQLQFLNVNAAGTWLLDAVTFKKVTGGWLHTAGDAVVGGAFQCAGDGHFEGDLTAASYADNSPVYVGADALARLAAIRPLAGTAEGDFAQVDHDSMPGLLLTRRHVSFRGKETGREYALQQVREQFLASGADDWETWLTEHFEPIERITRHRDLGRQIQVNTSAILELLTRIEALEGLA